MTVVNGDISDLCGVRDDGVVRVSATRSRPGYERAGMIVDSWRDVAVKQGKFTTPDLDPGPARFLVVVGSTYGEFRVNIPAEGPVEFHELVDAQFQYDPPVVGRAQAAASEAAESARRAAASVEQIGSAERVLEAEKVARAAVESTGADRAAVAADRVAVESARDEAVGAAASAVSDAEAGVRSTVSDVAAEALELSSLIERYRDEAEGFATTAGAKATDAGESATAAGEKATAAERSAEASEQARVAGEALPVQGRSLAEQGHADADRAEAARSQAEGYARTSGEQATLAEQHAREAAASAESAKQGAPEGGWTKAQLHVNVQAQLDKVDSLPTSQTVQSMIAGKADTTALQEGLAKKLDSMPVSENVTNSTLVKRTSGGKIKAADGAAADDVATISQLTRRLEKSSQNFTIYGVDNYGQKMFPYSGSTAVPLSVVMRSSDGTSVVADPTRPEHAATKNYVDGRTPQVKVVTALPSSPDPQTVYLVTEA